MNTFDHLLREVLQDDSNQEPPAGMTQRIVNSLQTEKKNVQARAAIKMATAAAIIAGAMGVATSPLVRNRTRPTAAPVFTRRVVPAVSINTPASEPQNTVGRRSENTILAAEPLTTAFRRASHVSHTIRISRMTMEPLVIAPIQIESLTQTALTTKGKKR